jgi:ketosteroid isomerase-like protein
MKLTLFIAAIVALPTLLFAQSDSETQTYLDDLNKRIDKAVVESDFASLKKWYADDFVFTHGSGHVDSKESWLKDIETSLAKSKFLYRQHDSTKVELHQDVAIVTGSLSIAKEGTDGVKNSYGVRYVRVYVKRKKEWQMISHRSVKYWGRP